MSQEKIGETVRQFVKINFLFDEKAELSDHKSLLGSGVIDSTGVLELITFLEQRFEVKFDDNELVSENFDTVSRISEFVGRKLGVKA